MSYAREAATSKRERGERRRSIGCGSGGSGPPTMATDDKQEKGKKKVKPRQNKGNGIVETESTDIDKTRKDKENRKVEK